MSSLAAVGDNGASSSLSAALNLMRRLPPQDTEDSLAGLASLLQDSPDTVDELLQRVDQPLQEATDHSCNRQYLICEYSRDGDSYRSPWSNTYDPPLESGTEGQAYTPRKDLRSLEVDANELLDTYRELYYEGGVSSVYLWDLEEGSGQQSGGFAGAFLIRHNREKEGCLWESTHVVQVQPDGGGGGAGKEKSASQATYKLNTTVAVTINAGEEAAAAEAEDGATDLTPNPTTVLSGNLTRSVEQTLKVDAMEGSGAAGQGDAHLRNIGTMLEAMETSIRRDIDGLYIQKTYQILTSVRSRARGGTGQQGVAFTSQLNAAIGSHGARRDEGLADKIAAMNIRKS